MVKTMIKAIVRLSHVFWLLLLSMSIQAQQTNGRQVFISSVEWNNDGTMIAAAGVNVGDPFGGYLNVVNVETGESVYRNEPMPGGYSSVTWSPDGRYLAVGGFNTIIEIVSIERREIIATLLGHEATINWLDWNHDGTRLVSAGTTDKKAILWDTTIYQSLRVLETADPWVTEFSPDGTSIAIGSAAGVEIAPPDLEVPALYAERQRTYEIAYVGAFDWSSDGSLLAVGSQTLGTENASIQLLDVNSGQVIRQIRLDRDNIFGLDWSSDGSLIAVSSNEGPINLWEVDLNTMLETYSGATAYPNKIAFSPFGGRLAYGLVVSAEQAARGTSLADSGVAIVVPAPSIERLNVIARGCISPAGLRDVALVTEAARLPEYIAQVEALSDEQISTGCRADVLAVARAVQSLP